MQANIDAKPEWIRAFRNCVRFSDSFGRLPDLILAWGRHALPDLPDAEWITVFGEIWSISDNVTELYDVLMETPFADALAGDTRLRAAMMSEAEREKLATLPDEVPVYRGCYESNKWGLSWTLDRNVAEGFPLLHRYRQDGQPLLISGIIAKSDIVAVKLCRDEAEIICERPKHHTIRAIHVVPAT